MKTSLVEVEICRTVLCCTVVQYIRWSDLVLFCDCQNWTHTVLYIAADHIYFL